LQDEKLIENTHTDKANTKIGKRLRDSIFVGIVEKFVALIFADIK
jgi:hypothetical protein